MINIIKLIVKEIHNTYYKYLFVESNRKKTLKYLIIIILCFSSWFIGYKWRDTIIIFQNIQISHLNKKRHELKTNIDQLESNLEDYQFMLNDGDYYRYLSFKHADITIPKNVEATDLKLITEQSKKYNIPFKYIYRLIYKESKYNPNATSGAGAHGYMQVMPTTFKSIKNMYEKTYGSLNDYTYNQQNILIGTYYLNYLYKKYKNWHLVFAAYNAGPGRVDEVNGIPNITETQNYVKYIIK